MLRIGTATHPAQMIKRKSRPEIPFSEASSESMSQDVHAVMEIAGPIPATGPSPRPEPTTRFGDRPQSVMNLFTQFRRRVEHSSEMDRTGHVAPRRSFNPACRCSLWNCTRHRVPQKLAQNRLTAKIFPQCLHRPAVLSFRFMRSE